MKPGQGDESSHAGGNRNRSGVAIATIESGLAMRLAGKIAIVIGAGQSPGEGIGNGRATVLRFVQEGARVFAVDRDLAAAEATAALAVKEGGECVAFQADVTREMTLAAAMA